MTVIFTQLWKEMKVKLKVPIYLDDHTLCWRNALHAYGTALLIGYVDTTTRFLYVLVNHLLCSFNLSDAGVLADIETWKKDLAQYSSQYVGQTLVYLNGTFEECRFRECNLGNLICDAMVIITDKHYC